MNLRPMNDEAENVLVRGMILLDGSALWDPFSYTRPVEDFLVPSITLQLKVPLTPPGG